MYVGYSRHETETRFYMSEDDNCKKEISVGCKLLKNVKIECLVSYVLRCFIINLVSFQGDGKAGGANPFGMKATGRNPYLKMNRFPQLTRPMNPQAPFLEPQYPLQSNNAKGGIPPLKESDSHSWSGPSEPITLPPSRENYHTSLPTDLGQSHVQQSDPMVSSGIGYGAPMPTGSSGRDFSQPNPASVTHSVAPTNTATAERFKPTNDYQQGGSGYRDNEYGADGDEDEDDDDTDESDETTSGSDSCDGDEDLSSNEDNGFASTNRENESKLQNFLVFLFS